MTQEKPASATDADGYVHPDDCRCSACWEDWEQEDVDYGTCPYFQAYTQKRNDLIGRYGPGTCSFGCWQEPACVTNEPEGGWPSQNAQSEASS